MKIDLKIGYDDLSKECKEQLKNLKLLGFDYTLHYPTIENPSVVSFQNNWTPISTQAISGSGISISSGN